MSSTANTSSSPPSLAISPSVATIFLCAGGTLFLVSGLIIRSAEFSAQLTIFLASSYAGSCFMLSTLPSFSLVAVDHEEPTRTHYVVLRGKKPGVFEDPITFALSIHGVHDAIHAEYTSLGRALERFEQAKRDGLVEKVEVEDLKGKKVEDSAGTQRAHAAQAAGDVFGILKIPQSKASTATPAIGSHPRNECRTFGANAGTQSSANPASKFTFRVAFSPAFSPTRAHRQLSASDSPATPSSPSPPPPSFHPINPLKAPLSGIPTEVDSESERDSFLSLYQSDNDSDKENVDPSTAYQGDADEEGETIPLTDLESEAALDGEGEGEASLDGEGEGGAVLDGEGDAALEGEQGYVSSGSVEA
ncbi:hypothetical protein SCHPADRAFT_886158 [Schizopora paradoxa]|uniref:Uncharacterized protein n=1 Tax=Schizopora paradoxa TaxID=27342 RepID=A0A0H2S2B0_9AGAM|nr:hypothetical protein SCHPADRAFT_886158 [Schizopora paradoxa]